MKNYGQFLNEENKQLKYQDAYNLIVKYINETLKEEKQINDYVPNYHIADVFKDVLKYLELEHKYPNEFHIEHLVNGSYADENGDFKTTSSIKKSNYHILSHINDYFNEQLLDENGYNEIHRVYQKLRGKSDYLRNILKLVVIELRDTIMKDLVDRTLNADKIKTH